MSHDPLLRFLGAAGVAGAMIAGSSSASFVSFCMVKSTGTQNGIAVDAYALYARMNGATDTILNAYNLSVMDGSAGANVDPYAQFYHKDNSTSNSNVLMREHGSWAPTMTSAANRQWDSYLVIGGVASSTNTTNADPSWNNGGSGAHAGSALGWSRPDLVNNGTIGWFNSSPPNNQGRVGNSPGLATTDVRLGNFVVDAGSNSGIWNLTIAYNNGIAGSPVQFATSVIFCPAPGALSMLCLAGLTRRRRR